MEEFTLGIYKYIQQTWQQPKKFLGPLWKERLVALRRDESVVRIERPTRLDRARSLGYKAKQGYIVARVRVPRGGKQRPRQKSGRRSKTSRRKLVLKKSYQWIAEERCNRSFPNCEVLGSYPVAKDGRYYWFETILADQVQVSKYPGMRWVATERGRVFRGKTSAGQKSRGLLHKGTGAEKIRPSLRAHKRLGK